MNKLLKAFFYAQVLYLDLQDVDHQEVKQKKKKKEPENSIKANSE